VRQRINEMLSHESFPEFDEAVRDDTCKNLSGDSGLRPPTWCVLESIISRCCDLVNTLTATRFLLLIPFGINRNVKAGDGFFSSWLHFC
jgi:hypothetical protein